MPANAQRTRKVEYNKKTTTKARTHRLRPPLYHLPAIGAELIASTKKK